MTWIRWETKTPQHELVGALAEGLRVRKAEALGLFTSVCCGFGEFRKDGRADQVTDTTLEQWAAWEGRRGLFANLFRDRCVEQRSGERDPIGTVKGWWRQAALLDKQVKDNNRPKPGKRPPNFPRDSPVKPARESRGKSAGFPLDSRVIPANFPRDSRAGSEVDVYDTTLPVRERSLSDSPPDIPAGESSGVPADEGLGGPSPADAPDPATAQEIQQRRERLKAGIRELQAGASQT